MSEEDKKHYHGHRERLREEFLKNPSDLPEYKFLELLLTYIYSRKDTKPLAKALLEKFGSIWGIINAHPAQLLEIDGLGESFEIFIFVLREFIPRYFTPAILSKKSINLDDISLLARSNLDSLTHEEVWAAFLDNGNRLISFKKIVTGFSDSSNVSPRMIAELALENKASGIVLVHNHPGGSFKASSADMETTKHMKDVLKHMGVRLLDHLIVSDGSVISLSSSYHFE